MKIFLSDFQEKYANDNKESLGSDEVLFERTVEVILDEIGSDAFKTTRSVNKSMADSIMVGIAQILKSGSSLKDIRKNYEDLLKNEMYVRFTQSGTSTETNVKGRIDLARNYFLGLR